MIKLILFTTQRSGSSYICQLLHNHPQIAMWGEVFLRESWLGGFKRFSTVERNYKVIYNFYCLRAIRRLHSKIPFYIPINIIARQYLDSFFLRDMNYINKNNESNNQGNLLTSDPEAMGFKLMVNQAKELPCLEKWIIKKRPKIIILKRNILNKYLSSVAATMRGIAHSREEVEQLKFKVDPDDFKKFFNRTIKEYEYLDSFKDKCDTIEIDYDEFFSNKQGSLMELLKFIGVNDELPVDYPKLKKLNRLTTHEMVLNYNEIKSLDSTLKQQYNIRVP